MKETLKNPFGLINGALYHVKDISKQCDVYCPECGNKLILKDGDIMVKHLSHSIKRDNCINESIIHKYIKQYLYEKIVSLIIKNHKVIFEGNKLKLAKEELLNIKEKYIEYRNLDINYIPDIFLVLEWNYNVAIEICYKNKKDLDYLNKILSNSNIDIVLEICVTEDDLIDFNEYELIKKANVIYNKIERKYSIAQEKVNKLSIENKNLKERIKNDYTLENKNLFKRIKFLNEELKRYKSLVQHLGKISENQREEIEKLEEENERLKKESLIYEELELIKNY